jgi:hypothetical protein
MQIKRPLITIFSLAAILLSAQNAFTDEREDYLKQVEMDKQRSEAWRRERDAAFEARKRANEAEREAMKQRHEAEREARKEERESRKAEREGRHEEMHRSGGEEVLEVEEKKEKIDKR